MSIGKIDGDLLLNAQRQLDSFIFENKSLDYDATTEERRLALLVELSELANEVKSFKFWSNKKINQQRALEEYVDVLHFLLSIVNETNTDVSNIEYPAVSVCSDKKQITLSLLELINKFFLDDLSAGVEKFFKFGSSLGFTLDDVMNEYHKKRELNKQRQKEGY